VQRTSTSHNTAFGILSNITAKYKLNRGNWAENSGYKNDRKNWSAEDRKFYKGPIRILNPTLFNN
jgi:hypothetical protein